MTLADRARATGTVIERFRDKPFAWDTTGNCIHLSHKQAKALKVKVPTVPKFRTPLGARKALKKMGFDTLEGLMDSMFPRIAPARMIVGDIGMVPGEAPFNALVVSVGGGKVVGWHGADLSRLQNIALSKADFVAAWAVGRLPL
ncbi:MAG: hypothetical protein EOP58_11770 [Sphingomonadales bacterium]|nr:MAG: hypothetical protein EOP58_11770 [Sphingomonadales bacterium]